MLESKAKWQFNEPDQETIEIKQKDLPFKSPIIKDLLREQGLQTKEEINRFLHPDVADLASPLALNVMDKAVERIQKAVNEEEKILIYGDYDADGICATALLLKTLHELGGHYDYYIPNRIEEGYGLNEKAIKTANEQGFKVIITVDTGIASFQEALLAKELGIDLIITDHHEVQEKLPEAYAIVNPKCSPDSFQELAGVGVAFKIAEQLLGELPKHLLDLVAIGTIADLVPLQGENRILVSYGLRELTQTNNVGIQALKEVCQMDDFVTEEQVGFLIAPRINAVGRIHEAELAVELLMSEDPSEAKSIAKKIDTINQKRQQMVRTIVQEAEEMLGESPTEEFIMIAKENWHEGVIGIVASRLVEKYGKPAMVLTIDQEKGMMKGSARSISNFHLFNACMNFRECFTHFGGHSQAAGLSFPIENFPIIKDKLMTIMQEQLTSEDYKQIIPVHYSAQLSELTEELYTEIRQLAPFGMGHPEPIFHIKATPSDIRQIGRLQNHLKLQFQEQKTKVEGIGFGFGDLYSLISKHAEVSIVGKFQMNEWNGLKTPQIVIEDLAIKDWQLFDHRGKKDVDLEPYVQEHEKNVMIKHEKSQPTDSHVTYLTYESDIAEMEIDALYIFDLPAKLADLKNILHKVKPKNIHLCMCLDEGTFLKPLPTREDFRWLYALIHNYQTFHLQKILRQIMQAKNWTEGMILFMLDVFAELEFIIMDDETIHIQQNPVKKDLQTSHHYRQRLHQRKVEEVLYYSTYTSLRKWFAKGLLTENSPMKGEIIHGL